MLRKRVVSTDHAHHVGAARGIFVAMFGTEAKIAQIFNRCAKLPVVTLGVDIKQDLQSQNEELRGCG